ncbi:hypothetical protein KKI22_01460 [Patescibacteria group bacterium]|nr:hypothetical protein [Patescibacteria group bacterium]
MYKMQLEDQSNQSEQQVEQQVGQEIGTVNQNQVDEMRDLRQNQDLMSKKVKKTFIIICSVAVLAGIMTGFGAFKLKNKGTAAQMQNVTIEEGSKIKNGDVFGVQDKDTFADSATGYIEKGGVDGEGSHKLLREGGETQTVALTSSVVDLDKLAGTEAKIYGETFKADKAGWFMDVGRVEVINVDAEAPIQTLE